jgi:hypothetical protein
VKAKRVVFVRRGKKEFRLYVKDDWWQSIPNLDFIEDIELYTSKDINNKDHVNDREDRI